MSRPIEGTRLTVAVLTYLRPRDLADLLPLLVEQLALVDALGAVSQVLIIDNDPLGGACEQVSAFSDRAVHYIHEPVPGITAGRNRALVESADSDLLVFIDDDERPAAQWLQALVRTWAGSSAAAVVGPVESEFTGELDPWIAAGAFFQRRRLPTGTPVDVAATNNLLLDLDAVRRLKLRFDQRFGLCGAEDTYFTRSLARSGVQLIWCAEAMVTDVVPASRMTRQWVLRRAFSSGNAASLTSVELADTAFARQSRRASGLANGALRTAGGGLRYLLGLLSRSAYHQTRGLRTANRGAGMVAGAVGLVYLEYARGATRRFRLRRFRSLTR